MILLQETFNNFTQARIVPIIFPLLKSYFFETFMTDVNCL